MLISSPFVLTVLFLSVHLLAILPFAFPPSASTSIFSPQHQTKQLKLVTVALLLASSMISNFVALPLLTFVHVFQLSAEDLVWLQRKGELQPFVIKLLGILARHQHVYLWRPLVFHSDLMMFKEHLHDPALWCWQGWYALFQECNSFMWNTLPRCFHCFARTSRSCERCLTLCTAVALKPVPTCTACRHCIACTYELLYPEKPTVALRYSFFLANKSDV